MKHDVIRRFVERIRQNARARGKQVIITVEEAQDIANDLTLLLLRESELLDEISTLKSQANVTEIVVKGGGF